MAINVPVPVKEFATLQDGTGVPISSMPELLGEERTISLALSGVPGPAASTRLTGGGVSRSDHDLLILSARHGSGATTVLDQTWNIDVEEFWSTTRAEEGDSITDSNNTAIVVEAIGGGDSMLIGRSNGGRMLVQQGNWANPGSTSTYMRLEAIVHDGGVLGRRLENVTSSVSRVVTLQQRSVARPAVPTDTEVTYDGISLAIDQNSEWVGLELAPTGNATLWYATTAFRQYSQGWEHDDWAIFAGTSTFSPEYSVDGGSTWSTTYPSTIPFLYRFRDADGTLHGPYSEGRAGGFDQILSRTITGNNPVTIAMTPAIDWSGTDLVSFSWKNNIVDGTNTEREGNLRSVLIPSIALATTALMTTGEQDNQILLRLTDHLGSGYSIGRGLISPSISDWLAGSTQQDQRIRIDLQGSAADLTRATRLVVRRGYTTHDGTLKIAIL